MIPYRPLALGFPILLAADTQDCNAHPTTAVPRVHWTTVGPERYGQAHRPSYPSSHPVRQLLLSRRGSAVSLQHPGAAVPSVGATRRAHGGPVGLAQNPIPNVLRCATSRGRRERTTFGFDVPGRRALTCTRPQPAIPDRIRRTLEDLRTPVIALKMGAGVARVSDALSPPRLVSRLLDVAIRRGLAWPGAPTPPTTAIERRIGAQERSRAALSRAPPSGYNV